MDAVTQVPLPIGWKERVDFPAWGFRSVRAKVDTGARTTALNVCDYELTEVQPGHFRVRFRPVVFRKRLVCGEPIEAEVVSMVMVRNTGGSVERRPVVETEMRLGPIVKRIRLTLTDRSRMRSPVILGRSALAGDFLVDVRHKYVQQPRRKKVNRERSNGESK